MRPPTDNLYKFAAIFGLVLVGFGTWLFNQQSNRYIDAQVRASESLMETWIEIYANEALRKLLQDQMVRVRNGDMIYGLSLKASELEGVNEEQVLAVRKFEFIGHASAIEIQRVEAYRFPIAALISIGALLSGAGFSLWWFRVQRYQDIILRSQTEEEVPEEIQDGPANVGRRWDDAEEEKLIDGFNNKKSFKQLSKDHGRTPGAIRSRLVKLGLLEYPDSWKQKK
ncbi:MAG: hypothetical protein AAGC44_01630 [Planctomycetota bacterium]